MHSCNKAGRARRVYGRYKPKTTGRLAFAPGLGLRRRTIEPPTTSRSGEPVVRARPQCHGSSQQRCRHPRPPSVSSRSFSGPRQAVNAVSAAAPWGLPDAPRLARNQGPAVGLFVRRSRLRRWVGLAIGGELGSANASMPNDGSQFFHRHRYRQKTPQAYPVHKDRSSLPLLRP